MENSPRLPLANLPSLRAAWLKLSVGALFAAVYFIQGIGNRPKGWCPSLSAPCYATGDTPPTPSPILRSAGDSLDD